MTPERCAAELERIATTSPMVKFLLEQMEKSGCKIKVDDGRFFKVERCEEEVLGSFVPGKGIKMCHNQISTRTDMENMLAHELIHAYDDCTRKNMNWLNVEHHACSEVRAANLSGDCHWVNEFFRGRVKLKGQHKNCARRRAELSVAMSPKCTESENPEECAREAVDKVFERCFEDTMPFDDIP